MHANEPPVKLSIIPKEMLKSIFLDVLLKFNTFRAGQKIYSQKSGLVMGNSLSPILANIFCYLMEKQVILPKYNKIVMFYCRYVDDVFAIVDKNIIESLMSEMNSFDSGLTFTLDRAKPNLPYLELKFMQTIKIICNINFIERKLHKLSCIILGQRYHPKDT